MSKIVIDCKTCTHGTTAYRRDKEDRFSASYSPLGLVVCARPRPSGRAYPCKDSRKNCAYYEQKERRS